MRFSIWPGLNQPWSSVLEVVQHAEQTGWDGAYVADHFMGAGGFFPVETPTFEATAAISGLAAATERLRLGTLVLSMTYRHPAVLAKWAATTDHISSGRLLLGIGAGWQENEHEQYGLRLGPPRERLRRFDEGCAAILGLLREATTDITGEHYTLSGAVAEPKPVQSPLPLLIGGKGDRMLRIVARHADEWNLWGLASDLDERAEEFEKACAEVDRDPATVARSAQALVFLTKDDETGAALVERVQPQAAVGGTIGRFSDAVADWAGAGIGEVIVPEFTLGTGEERRDRMDALLAAGRAAVA